MRSPLFIALAALLFHQAPQVQQAPEQPFTLQVNTQLVMVPFHVVQKDNFVTNLKASDVILFEDGKPRPFTTFDSPGTPGQLPLELDLLFDANPMIAYFWDPKDVFRFVPQWKDEMSKDILDTAGGDVRVAVYRCSGERLHKILAATKDSHRLGDTLRGLLTEKAAGPGDVAIPLSLPKGRDGVDIGPYTNEYVTSYFYSAESRGWPMEAGIGVLNDLASLEKVSPHAFVTFQDGIGTATMIPKDPGNQALDLLASPEKVSRVLVMFSEGIGATTTVPKDLGNQALDFGIPFFPIVTNYEGHITSSWPRNFFRMKEFASLGKMTGGRAIEHKTIDAQTLVKILQIVKSDGLSQYAVGFAPASHEGQPKQHTLEVRMAPKTKGTVEGGMRRATY